MTGASVKVKSQSHIAADGKSVCLSCVEPQSSMKSNLGHPACSLSLYRLYYPISVDITYAVLFVDKVSINYRFIIEIVISVFE